jgi:hypothetical protein
VRARKRPAENGAGWLKFMRGDLPRQLIRASRNAFSLAAIIALETKWREGFDPHGLERGEAMIGDHRAYGLSLQEYRTAKQLLAKHRIATFRPTTRGTVARLVDSSLFCIAPSTVNKRNGNQNNTRATNAPENPQALPIVFGGEERKSKEQSSRLQAGGGLGVSGERAPRKQRLTAADKITLEKERERLQKRLEKLRTKYDRGERWEPRDKQEADEHKVRIAAIDEALYIPL